LMGPDTRIASSLIAARSSHVKREDPVPSSQRPAAQMPGARD
jgi:hypothetical protein